MMRHKSKESEGDPRLVLDNDDGCRRTPRQRDALQYKVQDLFQFVNRNKVPFFETNKSCHEFKYHFTKGWSIYLHGLSPTHTHIH